MFINTPAGCMMTDRVPDPLVGSSKTVLELALVQDCEETERLPRPEMFCRRKTFSFPDKQLTENPHRTIKFGCALLLEQLDNNSSIF